MEPSFVLYLLGITGAMKSTLAALLLSFFGNFDNKSLPSSFKDTVNSLEKQGFLLKVADGDRRLSPHQQQAGSYEDAGDGAGCGENVRRQDGQRPDECGRTLRGSYVPRGNAIITGEDLPDIGNRGRPAISLWK